MPIIYSSGWLQLSTIQLLRTEELEEILALRFDHAAPTKAKKDWHWRDSEATSFSAWWRLKTPNLANSHISLLCETTCFAKDGNLFHYHIPLSLPIQPSLKLASPSLYNTKWTINDLLWLFLRLSTGSFMPDLGMLRHSLKFNLS